MLFNTINFAIFLPIVFILYWFLVNKSYKFQNILLLVSSYFFMHVGIGVFYFYLFFLRLSDKITDKRLQTVLAEEKA